MAPVFSLMTCVMLFLAVEHSVQAADSITVNESTLDDTLAKRGSSSGGDLATVVTELVASMKSMKEDLQKAELKLQKTEQNRQKTELKIQKAEQNRQKIYRDLLATTAALKFGSTYVRWGRDTCIYPAKLVYKGMAGGKHQGQKGSGTNILCLTDSPQFDNTPVPPHYGYLYGGEYQEIQNMLDYEIPCAVCYTPESTTIMIAGTFNCPRGWRMQYTGQLTAQHKYYYATEYVCLDGYPKLYWKPLKEDEGQHVFYYVITQCGSLPCPPYKNKKLVQCVVCSK